MKFFLGFLLFFLLPLSSQGSVIGSKCNYGCCQIVGVGTPEGIVRAQHKCDIYFTQDTGAIYAFGGTVNTNVGWVALSASGGTTQTGSSSSGPVDNNAMDLSVVRAEYLYMPAALCNNVTATTLWDLPTATPAVPTCVTGTNIQKGVLQWADTAGGFSAQTTRLLPRSWDSLNWARTDGVQTSTLDFDLVWTTPAVAGNIKWQVQFTCSDTFGTATDDPVFPTAGNPGYGTVITAAPTGGAARVAHSMVQITVPTACIAAGTDPRVFHIRIFRDGNDALDTITSTANLFGVMVTYYVNLVQPYNSN